jgi:mono/diheme cytochrome c family protein
MRIVLFFLLSTFSVFAQMPAAPPPGTPPPGPLVWDPPSQYYTATQNEVGARFTFKVKNVSASNYVIDDVKTSCECTAAGMPGKPWRLAPGEAGKLEAVVDLRDKMRGVTASEVVLKDIYVISTNATNLLTVAITIPPGLTNTLTQHQIDRIWGQKLAAVDRQAVFKSTCAQCHLIPAFGRNGENLYHATCGICHEASPRSPMVPDLAALKTEIDTNYWRTWVTYGKPGTLMPGFLNTEGGPLEAAQVDSLVAYLGKAFPRPMKEETNAPVTPAR